MQQAAFTALCQRSSKGAFNIISLKKHKICAALIKNYLQCINIDVMIRSRKVSIIVLDITLTFHEEPRPRALVVKGWNLTAEK